jgi:hypothetical protein
MAFITDACYLSSYSARYCSPPPKRDAKVWSPHTEHWIWYWDGMYLFEPSMYSLPSIRAFIQIDTYFQDAQPAEHVIIEGHPTCLGWMRHTGWYDRPGVRILEGRWQDFFPPNNNTELSHALSPSDRKSRAGTINIGKFDVVYFDTFEEGYRGHFSFIKYVPRLLRGPNSRFSYFNGHAEKHETVYNVCLLFYYFTYSLNNYKYASSEIDICRSCAAASQRLGHEHYMVRFVYLFVCFHIFPSLFC